MFAVAIPLAMVVEARRDTGAMYVQQAVGTAYSVAIGFVLELPVSRSTAVVKSFAELCMVLPEHMLFVVGVTYYPWLSALLAGITMERGR